MKNTSNLKLSAFEAELKEVLKRYDAPQRIGEESPLASLYFLGRAFSADADQSSASRRGKILLGEIRQAAASLWGGALPSNLSAMRAMLQQIRQAPGTPRYSYLVLELRCFQEFFAPKRMAEIWENAEYLPGSKSEHYRDFDLAVVHVGKELLKRLHPSLHSEPPPKPGVLIGQEAIIEKAIVALQAGKTVTIHGPDGVGKTGVGAAIAAALGERRCFWFTIRPLLNDRVGSLLFALGNFLDELGMPNLRQLMLASAGAVEDIQPALSALHQDLHGLASDKPVLCIDELDRLLLAGSLHDDPHHRQIHLLLDTLRGQLPLLLIGQKPILESDLYLAPTGLQPEQIMALFRNERLPLGAEEIAQLYSITKGNPRLLQLCHTLLQSGETLASFLNDLPHQPGLLSILYRLWQRLSSGEQNLLQRLAVFRTPAPEDAWRSDHSHLLALSQRHLLERDKRGGVVVTPIFRPLIYTEFSSLAQQKQAHRAAAQIRSQHGEYTSAAYHYWQAGETAAAIQTWYLHYDDEIRLGQAHAADSIFRTLSPSNLSSDLSSEEQMALALIQAELAKLRGEWEEGAQRLAHVPADASEINASLIALRAEFLDALGYYEQAITTYDQSIQIATRLLRRVAIWQRQRSALHIRQRNLAEARRDAQQVECLSLILRGTLAEGEGRYDEALQRYQEALHIAESLTDLSNLALLEDKLAVIYGYRQNLSQAIAHAQRAIAAYEHLHDRVSVASVYHNLAANYLNCNDFRNAVETAHKALDFFQGSKQNYWIATTHVNLANGYFGLGETEKAEHHAQQALSYNEPYAAPYALYTLGRLRHQHQQLSAAQDIFTQALQYCIQNEDQRMEAFIQRAIALVLFDQGQRQDGIISLQQSLAIFTQLGITEEIAHSREIMQKENIHQS